MKVLEIKNNLVKIAYDAEDNLALSGFVVIQDVNTPYVAQVMNLKADVTSNYAIVKLLFTFNEEGILKNYNGTIPSLKSTVTKLPSNELLDIIPVEEALKIGQLAQQNILLQVDKSILDNNLLVCSNNTENSIQLINNLISQIKEKVVVFDTTGTFEEKNKIVFGKDFKLPLNYNTINFIYENDLEDVDAVNKAVIQDIFIEVQEYTKTLPEGFLPFNTFLNVVDQQYKETQIPQLVLLKNKLLRYKDLNVFAQELKDILSLSIAIENKDLTIIDISQIPDILQKEVITYTYKVMSDIKDKIYSFVNINNSNTDKRLLKTFLQNNNVSTVIICPHEYKYLNELKENAQNIILFMPLTLQHDFSSYNTFLNKLNADEFIIYGAHTQNIPLIVELSDINEQPAEQIDKNNNLDETENNVSSNDIAEVSIEEEPEKPETEISAETTEDFPEYPDNIEYPDITIEEPVEIKEPDLTEDETQDIEITETPSEEPEIPNILEEDAHTLIEETPVNNEEDTEINDIKIEPLYEEEPSLNETDYSIENIDILDNLPPQDDNAEIVEQVAKDVDKVFYEKMDDETLSPDEVTDELTEDDLNLIDDINAGNDDENNIEITDFSEEQPPVLPIYPGEDIETGESQKFEPGDRVSTPKYGEGVVEKMIKYGNKMLCSIEFPNIGRRLLDPSMSEITKLS